MALPPTRQISYQQLVLEADPDWQKEVNKPKNYIFSNGRIFYGPPNPYS
jgi:hypothetical protein